MKCEHPAGTRLLRLTEVGPRAGRLNLHVSYLGVVTRADDSLLDEHALPELERAVNRGHELPLQLRLGRSRQLKTFEVRDEGTFIPVMCLRLLSGDGPEDALLRRGGYAGADPYYFLTNLNSGESRYDPHGWPASSRTLREAQLPDRAVVDVRYYLGEAARPAQSDL